MFTFQLERGSVGFDHKLLAVGPLIDPVFILYLLCSLCCCRLKRNGYQGIFLDLKRVREDMFCLVD